MDALGACSEDAIGTCRAPKGSRVSARSIAAASARETSSTRTVCTATGGIAVRWRWAALPLTVTKLEAGWACKPALAKTACVAAMRNPFDISRFIRLPGFVRSSLDRHLMRSHRRPVSRSPASMLRRPARSPREEKREVDPVPYAGQAVRGTPCRHGRHIRQS
jgi:hypothetical protein